MKLKVASLAFALVVANRQVYSLSILNALKIIEVVAKVAELEGVDEQLDKVSDFMGQGVDKVVDFWDELPVSEKVSDFYDDKVKVHVDKVSDVFDDGVDRVVDFWGGIFEDDEDYFKTTQKPVIQTTQKPVIQTTQKLNSGTTLAITTKQLPGECRPTPDGPVYIFENANFEGEIDNSEFTLHFNGALSVNLVEIRPKDDGSDHTKISIEMANAECQPRCVYNSAKIEELFVTRMPMYFDCSYNGMNKYEDLKVKGFDDFGVSDVRVGFRLDVY